MHNMMKQAGAGLTEIKANSTSQQSWSWGLAELGNKVYFVNFI